MNPDLQFGHKTSMGSAGASRRKALSRGFPPKRDPPTMSASVTHPRNFSPSKTPNLVIPASTSLRLASFVEAFGSILKRGDITSFTVTSSGFLLEGMNLRSILLSVSIPTAFSPLNTTTPEEPVSFMILEASRTLVETLTRSTPVCITSLTLASYSTLVRPLHADPGNNQPFPKEVQESP